MRKRVRRLETERDMTSLDAQLRQSILQRSRELRVYPEVIDLGGMPTTSEELVELAGKCDQRATSIDRDIFPRPELARNLTRFAAYCRSLA